MPKCACFGCSNPSITKFCSSVCKQRDYRLRKRLSVPKPKPVPKLPLTPGEFFVRLGFSLTNPKGLAVVALLQRMGVLSQEDL